MIHDTFRKGKESSTCSFWRTNGKEIFGTWYISRLGNYKRNAEELGTFLGSETIKEMQTLYSKLRHEEYCKRRGITYEEMTEDDFIEAELERYTE